MEIDNIYLSIILPTYNRSHIIEECVESICSQSYDAWELIIIDDCSADNSREVLERLEKRDDRIRSYTNRDHLGLHKSRNKALSLSKGDIIFFIEDDIILDPNCLKVLINTYVQLKASGIPVGAIAPSLILINETSKAQQRKIFDYFKAVRKDRINAPCIIDSNTGLIYTNWSPTFESIHEVPDVHACSLYDKDIFKITGFFEESAYIGNYMYGETELNFKIRANNMKLCFQPKAIAYHKTANTGGCRQHMWIYSYYAIRNHILFVKRNFGIRAAYMIPFFFIFSSIVMIQYIIKGKIHGRFR